MGLAGKMVEQIAIKSEADVFHELLAKTPYEVPNIAPEKVKGCDLHEAEWGSTGTILSWRYVHEGKERVAKEVVEAIEPSKLITFKMLEGDLMELYSSFQITIQVDTSGEDNLVTWTLVYEKLNENVDDPVTLMEFFKHLTKDIEAHHIKKN